jgi:hypothetical protein
MRVAIQRLSFHISPTERNFRNWDSSYQKPERFGLYQQQDTQGKRSQPTFERLLPEILSVSGGLLTMQDLSDVFVQDT